MLFEYSKQAKKAIGKTDVATKARIRKGILAIPKGDIKPLKGSPGSYRLRVGNWRILFSYAKEGTVLIEKISPRGDVYKEV
jgi:mRNA interferase RelE/StbE